MSTASLTMILESSSLWFHKLHIRFCPCKVGSSVHVSPHCHDGYCPLNPECPSNVHMLNVWLLLDLSLL